MKKKIIGYNEIYSIDIAPLTTKAKKLRFVTELIKDLSFVAMGLMTTWILVILYLIITGK